MTSTILRLPVALALVVYQSVVLAFTQIWANKVRGILTTLGILIGVAAISAVIALIDGMKQKVLAEFEAFGANKIFISPQWPRRGSQGWNTATWKKVVFRNDDFDHLLDRCPSVQTFTRDAGYGGIPLAYREKAEYDRLFFHSVDSQWHEIGRRSVSVGRGLSVMDIQQHRRVCLINGKLRDRLQMDRDPTGELINVMYFGRLLVIGVVDPPVSFTGAESETGEVVVPFTFSTYKFNFPTWYTVMAESKSRQVTEEAKAEVEFYLRQVRGLKPGDEPTFSVQTAQRAIDDINVMAGVVTTVAVGIVGISLLVGGVGIMNIMLVSVSERTREIGLRKAVGARPAAILLQFLIEAIVLCLVGGAMGLIVGQLMTSGVAAFLPGDLASWNDFKPGRDALPAGAMQNALSMLLPPLAIGIAFGFSVAVGLVFGMFPAIKAARLDPIEALRHE